MASEYRYVDTHSFPDRSDDDAPTLIYRLMAYAQDARGEATVSETEFLMKDGLLMIRICMDERVVELRSTGNTVEDMRAIMEARRELMQTG